jgi:hypothetical protein
MNRVRTLGVAISLVLLVSVLVSCGTAEVTPEPTLTPAGTSQPSGMSTYAATRCCSTRASRPRHVGGQPEMSVRPQNQSRVFVAVVPESAKEPLLLMNCHE